MSQGKQNSFTIFLVFKNKMMHNKNEILSVKSETD